MSRAMETYRYAVEHAIRARRGWALLQYCAQGDTELLQELSYCKSPSWYTRVRNCALAICGDPTRQVCWDGLDEDALRYLSLFG